MKRIVLCILALTLALFLSACGNKAEVDQNAFIINVICESDGIYQIFYSCYLDDQYYGMGGIADYYHNELSADTELKPMFSKAYFEEREDVSSFSIDFSPYGKDDTSEIGTTNRVYIAAEYGKSYTVIISGDGDSGFTAQLAD